MSAAFGLYLAVYGMKRRGTEIAGRAASVCLAVFVCLSVSLTLCLCACASECLCDACTFVPQPQSDTAGHAEHPGFTDGMKMLARSRQYVLQCLCYSCAYSVQHNYAWHFCAEFVCESLCVGCISIYTEQQHATQILTYTFCMDTLRLHICCTAII